MRAGDAQALEAIGLRVCDDPHCLAPFCRECGRHTKPVDSLHRYVGWDVPGYVCDCGWAIERPNYSEGWRW